MMLKKRKMLEERKLELSKRLSYLQSLHEQTTSLVKNVQQKKSHYNFKTSKNLKLGLSRLGSFENEEIANCQQELFSLEKELKLITQKRNLVLTLSLLPVLFIFIFTLFSTTNIQRLDLNPAVNSTDTPSVLQESQGIFSFVKEFFSGNSLSGAAVSTPSLETPVENNDTGSFADLGYSDNLANDQGSSSPLAVQAILSPRLGALAFWDSTPIQCSVDGSASSTGVACDNLQCFKNEDATDATIDSCVDGSGNTFMGVRDIWLNATSLSAGSEINVICGVYCYSSSTRVAIAYNNGTGWRQIQSGSCNVAGTADSTCSTANHDWNYTTNITVDNVLGQHTVRCMEQWSTAFTATQTCTSEVSYADNDDLNFTVTSAANSPPSVDSIYLNATDFPNNSTNANLTLNLSVSDADGDSVKNITTWYVNGTSWTLLNMPFEKINGTAENNSWDYSNFGNNGSVFNATWNATGGFDGKGAYDFNGTSYIDVGSSDSLNDIKNQVTLIAWVKPTTGGYVIVKDPPVPVLDAPHTNDLFSESSVSSGSLQAELSPNKVVPGNIMRILVYENNTSYVNVSAQIFYENGSDLVQLNRSTIDNSWSYYWQVHDAVEKGKYKVMITAFDESGKMYSKTLDWFDPPKQCSVDGSASSTSVSCSAGTCFKNEDATDATTDTCVDSTSAGYMAVRDIYFDASALHPGDTMNVNCENWCYSTLTRVAIAYNNGTGWRQIQSGSCVVSGSGDSACTTAGHAWNYSAAITVDNVIGPHSIRCMEQYNTLFTATQTCTTASYGDNDDLNFTVANGKLNVPFSLSTMNGGEFLVVSDGTSYNATAGGDINDGNWHQLAATYDGSMMKLYVDGALSASSTSYSGALPNNTYPVWIGRNYDPDNSSDFFNGTIDEVQIYNRSLSAEQITAFYNNQTSLIVSNETALGDTWSACVTPNDGKEDGNRGCSNNVTIIEIPNYLPSVDSIYLNTTDFPNNYTTANLTLNLSVSDADGDPVKNITNWYVNGTSWTLLNMPFEEINGTTTDNAWDYSGYGNNATVVNALWGSTVGYDGKGGYSFDGNEDYLNFNTVDFGNQFTIELWTKPNDLPDQIITLMANSGSGGSTDGFRFVINTWNTGDGKIIFETGNGAATAAAETNIGAITFGQWNHIVVVVNKSLGSAAIYLDGGDITSVSTIRTDFSTSSDFEIGRMENGLYDFSGIIDEVRVFNRSLSAEQILALYQNRTDMVVSNETTIGDNWSACVTPNDGNEDGAQGCSNNVTFLTSTIPNNPPDVTAIYLNATDFPTNSTNANLTLNLSVSDADGDPVKNITNWYVNSTPLILLNMPFEEINKTTNNNIEDYSDYGYSGTENSAIWSSTSGYDGKGAYSFSNPSSGISIALATEANDFTVIFRTKYQNYSLGDGSTLSIGSGHGFDVGFSLNGNPYFAVQNLSLTNWSKYNNSIPPVSNNISYGGRIPFGEGLEAGDTQGVLYPTVLKDGNTYKMWYAGFNSSNYAIYYATSPEGLIWTKYNNSNPLKSDSISYNGQIPLGTGVSGDNYTIDAHTILRDNGIYKMWYAGGTDSFIKRIYYATSPDGLIWTKYDNSVPVNSDTTSTNGRIPLGTLGSGDNNSVEKPVVLKDGNTYKMWYSGCRDVYSTICSVYYATSSDGLSWTKYNNSIPPPSNNVSYNGQLPIGSSDVGDNNTIFGSSIIKVSDEYKMWYGAISNSGFSNIYSIFYATSPDGLTWNKVNNTLPQSSNTTSFFGQLPRGLIGAGDAGFVYAPLVIKDDRTYKMWYSGYSSGNRIYYATLSNGINSSIYPEDSWTQLAVNKQGNEGSLYVDGQEISTSNFGTIKLNGTLHLGDYFNGTIDEVQIYNRSLSSEQIMALYNNRTDLIVGNETTIGDNWSACVTPNDGKEDGSRVCSNNVTIFTGPPLCGTITSNTTLTQSITATGTCITFGASNIELDCAGYQIEYGTGASGYGIYTNQNDNITIKNCLVKRGGSGSFDSNNGIYVNDSIGADILNNTVLTNGTSLNYALYLVNANSTIIANNTLSPYGSDFDNLGVYLLSSSNNILEYNFINTNGLSFGNMGIYLYSYSLNNTIKHNIISTNGTSSNYGINVLSNSYANIINNTIFTNGTANSNYGIYFYNDSANIVNNTIHTDGTIINFGIDLAGSNNVLDNNVIVAGGTGGINNYGLYLGATTNSNIIVNNNITSVDNLLIADTSIFFNYLVYNNSFGEIRWTNTSSNGFLNNLTLNSTNDLGIGIGRNLFIDSDIANLNVTAFSTTPRINSSANITLNGLAFTDPILLRDSFRCDDTDTCNILSYTGGTLIADVSYMGNFSAREIITAPVLIYPADGSTTTNRTPEFVWNNSVDQYSDVLNYNFTIDDTPDFSSPVFSWTNITNVSDVNITFEFPEVLDVDTTYFWKVAANDSTGYGSNSSVFNFTVQSYLAISIINNSVDFGQQAPGAIVGTGNNTYQPFYAENVGNIEFNITINASSYFNAVPFPSDYYQFEVREKEINAFNLGLSQTTYTNMTATLSSTPHLVFLNWSNQYDDFYTDILVKVPTNESAGAKSSLVTFNVEG